MRASPSGCAGDAIDDRPHARLQHPRDPCRRGAGRRDRRAGDADLPDDIVRLRRRRPCRVAVRPAGVRQHLLAHRQPDLRGAGGARRGARGRHGGSRRRLRPRGPVPDLPRADAAGRRVRRREQALRRLDQPVQPLLQELRLERALGRRRRPVELRGRGHAAHQGHLRRESIANPGGVIVDLEAIAAIAKRHNIPLIVDNTMASPYLIRPFEYGADIVVHSATKFLGGHGNSIGGVIVDGGSFNWIGDDRYPMLSKPRPEYGGMVLGETFGNFAFAIATRVLGLRDMGPALSPFNAFLILQGIETLPLRMQRHVANALTVAEHLDGHKAVTWVSYPGLRGDRYHASPSATARGRRRGVHLRPRGRLRRRACAWSRTCGCSRISPISATPARSSSTRPRRRTASSPTSSEERRRRSRGRAPVDRPRGRRGSDRRSRPGARRRRVESSVMTSRQDRHPALPLYLSMIFSENR